MRHDETTNFYYVQYTYCISIRIKILVILSFILKLLWTYIFGFQPGDFEKKNTTIPPAGIDITFCSQHLEPPCSPFRALVRSLLCLCGKHRRSGAQAEKVFDMNKLKRTWKKYGHFSQAIATRTYFNTFFCMWPLWKDQKWGVWGEDSMSFGDSGGSARWNVLMFWSLPMDVVLSQSFLEEELETSNQD